MNYKKVGNFIKDIRKSKGLSIKQVAEKTRFTKEYLSEVEKGQKYPFKPELGKIAKALDTPLSIILFIGAEKSEIAKEMLKIWETLSPELQKFTMKVFTGKLEK
ncbi:MAG: helix-turn-helix transcriptional regulator [Candidatus Paceibacterota bacterium]|jgi:transcriptional regulator with XRE-family HTH domain